MVNMKRLLLILVLLGIVTSCSDRYGVISGIFRLRDDSPLPLWFAPPKGVCRDQLKIVIVMYDSTRDNPFGGRARIIVKKKHWLVFTTVQEEVGSWRWHPDSEREKAPAATYPNWTIVEVDGTKQVYEQADLNDLLKIVDKPLWNTIESIRNWGR